MSMRAARILSLLATLLLAFSVPVSAQSERRIATTPDSDYFGFDLRTEQDVPLDACEAVCLADPDCRAFTYNTRAQWCFLKSDYSTLNPFPGAVAGRVLVDSGEPDLGAPPALDYVPQHLRDEALRYRANLVQETPDESTGIVFLSSSAASAISAGDPRAAVEARRAALVIDPDDVELWTGLARAQFAIEPSSSSERTERGRDGMSAALNA